MAAMSDYLEGALLDHVFRGTAYTQPTTIAIALATAPITDADTGATISECGGTGYARVDVGRGDDKWTLIAPDGKVENTNAITFPKATGDWGTITDVAILDNATAGAGNVLWYGQLSTPKTVNNGDTFQFNIGQLVVQIDD